jgi:hypothetical protein
VSGVGAPRALGGLVGNGWCCLKESWGCLDRQHHQWAAGFLSCNCNSTELMGVTCPHVPAHHTNIPVPLPLVWYTCARSTDTLSFHWVTCNDRDQLRQQLHSHPGLHVSGQLSEEEVLDWKRKHPCRPGEQCPYHLKMQFCSPSCMPWVCTCGSALHSKHQG